MESDWKWVFISLPMSGRSDEEIMKDLAEIHRAYINKMPTGKTVAFCHNFNPELRARDNGAKAGLESVWYLGKALEQISKCDAVCFCGDWRISKGCIIERMVCEKYDIPCEEDPRE